MSESDDVDPAAELPDPGDRPDDVESITDPNQYALRRRLGQILDAREAVATARREINTDERFRGINSSDLRQKKIAGHIAQAVHIYAIEVEPLISGAGDDLETEWPPASKGNPWEDLEEYIDHVGYVPADCPAACVESGSDDTELLPPKPQMSFIIYRYLNRAMADLGLDINRVEDTPFNRY